jgi:hypothetical protein
MCQMLSNATFTLSTYLSGNGYGVWYPSGNALPTLYNDNSCYVLVKYAVRFYFHTPRACWKRIIWIRGSLQQWPYPNWCTSDAINGCTGANQYCTLLSGFSGYGGRFAHITSSAMLQYILDAVVHVPSDHQWCSIQSKSRIIAFYTIKIRFWFIMSVLSGTCIRWHPRGFVLFSRFKPM